MILKNASVLFPDGSWEQTDIHIENGKINDFSTLPGTENSLDLTGFRILPGLVDMHIHGFNGEDIMEADYASIDKISKNLAKNGVTSFVPTTNTSAIDMILKALANISQAKKQGTSGASICAAYMEGPYISSKNKGGMNEKYILKPDSSHFDELIRVSGGLLRVMTIAPEEERSGEFIAACIKRGIIPSIGHTATDYDTASSAFQTGICHATHMFNAMSGFKHREPGVVGAIFDSNITGEIICDGIHVHPAAIRTAYRLLGDDRMILISDNVQVAGLGDGIFIMHGHEVTVNNGKCQMPDGTIDGNTNPLWYCVNKATEFGIPFESAMKMATINPAERIGIDGQTGSIMQGKDADLIVVDKHNTICMTIVKGKKVYSILPG